MSKWNLAGPLFIVVLAGLAVIVLMRQAREASAPPVAQPANASVAASSAPPRSVSVNAGIVGARFIITNLGTETLRNLLVRINTGAPTGPYELTMGRLGANQTQHFDPSRLRRADGRPFNPAADPVQSITVLADTSDGRGSWTGSYQ